MPTSGGTVLDAIVAANNYPNIFSLCVNQNNPFMSFGQDYYGSSGFVWTDIAQTQGTYIYYTVTVTDFLLSVGGAEGVTIGLTQSQLNNAGVIVDSGTTLIALDDAVYTKFFNQLSSLCSSGVNLKGVCGQSEASSIFHNPFALSSSDISDYPTLQFVVPCSKGNCTTLDVPPQIWIVQYTSTTYTAGISNNGVNGGSILGDVFMMNFHVVFDKSRNQLGFASQSTCNLNGKAAGETLHSALIDTAKTLIVAVKSLFI